MWRPPEALFALRLLIASWLGALLCKSVHGRSDKKPCDRNRLMAKKSDGRPGSHLPLAILLESS